MQTSNGRPLDWSLMKYFPNARQKQMNITISLHPKTYLLHNKALLRSSVSGLLWTKQFYYLDVFKWLFGEPNETPPDRNHKAKL